MQPLSRVAAVAIPMAEPNIDTDQILPARFLPKPRSGGFGQFLFHDRRFKLDGTPDPDFALNRETYRDARIILADQNFGCGSSRENAVWALHDYGFAVVIAPSFGDIFYNNSLKNGLLPIRLPADAVSALMAKLKQAPRLKIEVDLEAQAVSADGLTYSFDIDPFAKHCLLEGLDELDYTLSHIEEIKAYEERHQHEEA
jgi:3-isopropylmalate/(R)-2-methylmalate dehydratase small subunit